MIRKFQKEDIEALTSILQETRVFNPNEIDVAVELMQVAAGDPHQKDYILYTFVEEPGIVRGYYCMGHTPMTVSTYDLYWIAVDLSCHGKGIGKQLLLHCEELAKSKGGTLIIAETSSLPKYENTRMFYLKNNYTEASRIRDFYSPGDGLVVYCKYL
ncbi:MAG: GNAT family N-acetyltransferase [bacterium]